MHRLLTLQLLFLSFHLIDPPCCPRNCHIDSQARFCLFLSDLVVPNCLKRQILLLLIPHMQFLGSLPLNSMAVVSNRSSHIKESKFPASILFLQPLTVLLMTNYYPSWPSTLFFHRYLDIFVT